MKKPLLFVAVLISSLHAFSVTHSVPGTYATIQAAIIAAASGDIIDIAAGTYTEKFIGWSSVANAKSLTIQGAGIDQTIVQASATSFNSLTVNSMVFDFDAAYVTATYITIQNMTIQNAFSNGSGGGVRFNNTTSNNIVPTLNLTNLKIQNNSGTNGAGVYCAGAVNLTIEKCNITGNKGTGNGAGLSIEAWGVNNASPITTLIKNSTISLNEANGNGSGIFVMAKASFTTELTVQNTTIYGNQVKTSAKNGGGIYMNYATNATLKLTVNHSTIVGNTIFDNNTNAVGIYTNGPGSTNRLTINNSIVIGNTCNGVSNTATLSQISATNLSNGGVSNSFFTTSAGANIVPTWLTASGTNFHNDISNMANLAFASDLSSDITPVLTIGLSSAAKNYVVTDNLSPVLTTDQLANSRVYYPDAGAYENQTSPAISVPSGTVNSNTIPYCSTCDVTIASRAELNVNEVKTLKSITLSPGGKLTLNSGSALSVTNGLTLLSSSSAPATFVDRNSGIGGLSGTTSVQQDLNSARNWYISSPINNAIAPSGYTYYKYHEKGDNSNTLPQFTTTYWENIGVTPTMIAGIGYVANLASGTAQFTLSGILNSGKVEIPLTREGGTNAGFNLIGNPFPSYLNIDSLQYNTDIEPTYWYRSYNSGYVFDTYNIPSALSTGLSGKAKTAFIPPMQAFWVRVKSPANAATINFYRCSTSCSHQDDANNLFRAPGNKTSTSQILRLQVSNGTVADEAIVYINENAANGYDVYDSPKYSNSSASIPEIYTLADNEQVAINGFKSFAFDTYFPLGFKTGQTNTFTIKATEISNFEEGTQVYIKDILTNADYDLTDGSSYSFSSVITNNTDRFRIQFRSPSITTSNIHSNYSDNLNVSVYKNANNQITINCKYFSKNAQVSVYNAVGQKLLSDRITKIVTIIDATFKSGVYIVTITNAGKSITRKIISE